MQRTIPIPYYTSTLALHVEEENLKAVLTAKMHGFHAEKSQEQLVLDALEHPVGSPRLRTLAEGKRKIVIVTSDHTRAVPSKITLPLLLKEIRSGNPDADITILIATGLHRPTTEEEQRRMFGDAIVDHEKIAINNAFAPEQFVELCTLPSGAVFQVNRLAGHVDEDEFGAPVGMLAPHHVPVGAVHIEDSLDHKGNVLLPLHHHQMAPLVAVLGKGQHLYFTSVHTGAPPFSDNRFFVKMRLRECWVPYPSLFRIRPVLSTRPRSWVQVPKLTALQFRRSPSRMTAS